MSKLKGTCPRCQREDILLVVLRLNGGVCGVCRGERQRKLAGKPVPPRSFPLTPAGEREAKRRARRAARNKNKGNGNGGSK